VTDLQSISVDRTFSLTTQSEAKGLSTKLKNKNSILTLQFTLHDLQMLSHWSKRLQQRVDLLIGINQYKLQMIATFEELKNSGGSFLSHYLNSVICSDSIRRNSQVHTISIRHFHFCNVAID